MRFYELDDGRITIDGIDTRDLPRDALRRAFGMVLQDTWLFHGTIRENIAYGRLDATEEEIRAAAEAAHVDHFVRTLTDGYDTVIDDDATNVSAGEKQLLTIARAFLADPPILILDEATSLGRHPDRGPDPARDVAADEGPDDVRDRPPPVDDPRRRHDPRHGARPDRRAGQPRAAARPAAAPTPTSTRASSPGPLPRPSETVAQSARHRGVAGCAPRSRTLRCARLRCSPAPGADARLRDERSHGRDERSRVGGTAGTGHPIGGLIPPAGTGSLRPPPDAMRPAIRIVRRGAFAPAPQGDRLDPVLQPRRPASPPRRSRAARRALFALAASALVAALVAPAAAAASAASRAPQLKTIHPTSAAAKNHKTVPRRRPRHLPARDEQGGPHVGPPLRPRDPGRGAVAAVRCGREGHAAVGRLGRHGDRRPRAAPGGPLGGAGLRPPDGRQLERPVADRRRSGHGPMWGLLSGSSSPANPYGSGAIGAWAQGVTGSHNIVVGVVDEGIQVDHPDLAANIWTNPWDPPNGLDDDGNGYVDDVHGWDFKHNDNSVYDGPATDDHATHVAGTIGAVGGNGTGVVGVNWNVTLISAKFLEGTGDTADAIRAIDYLTDLKVRHGLQIVASNNSWGGGGFEPGPDRRDQPRRRPGDPVRRRERKRRSERRWRGRVLSGGRQVRQALPVRCARGWDCIVSVAAITKTGALASYSNFGTVSVDLGAPGSDILSTYPPSQYAWIDGTSMAAPHVTGAARPARFLQLRPDAEPAPGGPARRGDDDAVAGRQDLDRQTAEHRRPDLRLLLPVRPADRDRDRAVGDRRRVDLRRDRLVQPRRDRPGRQRLQRRRDVRASGVSAGSPAAAPGHTPCRSPRPRRPRARSR